MTEERKFAILFTATILAARRLIDLDPDKPNMAKGFFVDRAIDDAVFSLTCLSHNGNGLLVPPNNYSGARGDEVVQNVPEEQFSEINAVPR